MRARLDSSTRWWRVTRLDLLGAAKAALGAATTTDDPDLRAFYLASARTTLVQVRAEVGQIASTLDAIEKEALRVWKKTQLAPGRSTP